LDLPAESPVLTMPWIITFGPLSDNEEWEPVVCGPYEHVHALALAEAVVADEELMAVVEPLLPHVSVEEIYSEIGAARLAADAEDHDQEPDEGPFAQGPTPNGRIDGVVPSGPPTPEEVRAGFIRIAQQLIAG
jgi:hypothetical protein